MTYDFKVFRWAGREIRDRDRISVSKQDSGTGSGTASATVSATGTAARDANAGVESIRAAYMISSVLFMRVRADSWWAGRFAIPDNGCLHQLGEE